MKRFLLGVTLILFVGSYTQAYSQSWLEKLGNKAAKQAENKAKKKVEDKVSKTVDKTVDDVFNKTEGAVMSGKDTVKNSEKIETTKEPTDTTTAKQQ